MNGYRLINYESFQHTETDVLSRVYLSVPADHIFAVTSHDLITGKERSLPLSDTALNDWATNV